METAMCMTNVTLGFDIYLKWYLSLLMDEL